MYFKIVLAIFVIGGNWCSSQAESTLNALDIGPEDVDEIYTVVENLLKKFLSPNSVFFDNFKLKNRPKTGIIWNATAVGDSIIDEIRLFLQNLGVNVEKNPPETAATLNRLNSQDLIFYELFNFPHQLLPLGLRAILGLNECCRRNNYVGMGYSPVQLSSLLRRDPRGEDLLIAQLVGKTRNLIGGLHDCWNSHKSNFDLVRATVGIAKYPPELASNVIKNRLKKPVIRHPTTKGQRYSEYEAVTCHALTHSNRIFKSCLSEAKRMKNCISRKTSGVGPRKTYYSLFPSTVNLIKSVDSLDKNCTIDDQIFSINCSNFTQPKQNFDVASVISNFAGPTAAAAATQLVDQLIALLQTSDAGSNIVSEISMLIQVFQEAISSKDRLEKSSADVYARQRYEKLNRTLQEYKRNVIATALSAIDGVRQAATSAERVVVNSMSRLLGIDFSEHLRSMRCLSKLIDAILQRLFGNSSNENMSEGGQEGWNGEGQNYDFHESHETSDPNNWNSWDSYQPGEKGKDDAALDDQPVRNLIVSLRRLSQTKLLRRSNTIATLANTFLLATMFYECISVLAAAMYGNRSAESSTLSSSDHADEAEADGDPWDSQIFK